MRVAGWLLILCGCGRFGFGAHTSADAPSDDAQPDVDAEVFGPFAPAVQVPSLLASFDDDDPAQTFDGLELFFSSNRAGTNDIWVAQRATRTDPWGAPVVVAELQTAADEKGPEVSKDALSMWFDKAGDIQITSRASRTSPWSTPVLALKGTTSLGTPAVCDSERRMFIRAGDSTVGEIIQVSVRAAVTDAWPPPTPVPGLDLGFLNSGPWVSADCKRLYFDSNVAGNERIYFATFDEASGQYSTPAEITELTPMQSNIHDASLTGDEHAIVFGRATGGFGHIWESER